MLNAIWFGMMLISVITALFTGRLDAVVSAVTDSAKIGFEIALGLAGIMALWLGIMEIASQSGLISKFARLLRPVMTRLFPEVPHDHPAMGAMIMNISANMLGLSNAATPFGLQAMKELQRLNTHINTASNAMCTFLAINTSGIQLIPATSIAFLAANGNLHPSNVILSTLLATMASTIVAIVSVKYFSTLKYYKIEDNLS
tara:strand:+ start:331 stop:933 length:603 start_codon:yes stop_codon:yes gene_type:complete